MNSLMQNEEYYKIIRSTKDLFDILEPSDSLEVFMIYSYMLWNGFFSINKSYYYDSKREIYDEIYGKGVMTGGGTCVENSYLLNDIYRCLGYDSLIIHNKLKNIKINERLIRPKIKTNHFKPSNEYDHLSVLVKDNKYNFIYDPTNILCFNLVKENKAKLINGTGYMKIDLNWDLYSELELMRLNRMINRIDFKNKYNKKEVLKSMKESIKKCHDRINELYLFYLDNEENIKKLVMNIKSR